MCAPNVAASARLPARGLMSVSDPVAMSSCPIARFAALDWQTIRRFSAWVAGLVQQQPSKINGVRVCRVPEIFEEQVDA
jgi:hypothetical protein